MTEVRIVDAPPSVLGEGPMWCAGSETLLWIDISGKCVHRFHPASGTVETRPTPYAPAGIFPHLDGGLLLVTKKGLARLDFASGAVDSIRLAGVDFSQEVFNDGGCDRLGRLWVGTRDIETTHPRGSLYSIAPDYTLTKHETGFVVSNGIAWSPDGRLLYHTDTRPGRIDVCEFDLAAGRIAGRRPLIAYGPNAPGRPDGCTVDEEGGIWVAEVGAARVARYQPDGTFDRAVATPTSRPTSVMFGGPGLRTLYITSMRFRLSEADLAREPGAGMLMAVEPGVAGLPEPPFGGPS